MLSRWLKPLLILCRLGLAALFLFAAGAKLYTINDFVANLSNLVPAHLTWPVAVVVIAVEIIAAVLLLWPRAARAGAALSALLLVGFAGYALYYVYVLHGEPLECGCFGGIIASQLGVSTALRNLALVVPALLIFFGSPKLSDRGRASGALL